MKRRLFALIIASITLQCLNAQTVTIYKSNGTSIDLLATEIDSVVFKPIVTETDEAIETDEEVVSKITATFIGGAVTSINGVIQHGSQLSFRFKNSSSKDVVLDGLQLNNGSTGAEGNFNAINTTVAAGESVAYTITVGIFGISSPICRFTYTYNGKQYHVDAAY